MRDRHFGVAMLGGVEVQHEVDQRPLQSRTQPGEQQEPAARDLGRPLEIEQAQIGGQIPMRLGLERELRHLSPVAHDLVLSGAPPPIYVM